MIGILCFVVGMGLAAATDVSVERVLLLSFSALGFGVSLEVIGMLRGWKKPAAGANLEDAGRALATCATGALLVVALGSLESGWIESAVIAALVLFGRCGESDAVQSVCDDSAVR